MFPHQILNNSLFAKQTKTNFGYGKYIDKTKHDHDHDIQF